jgi:hypothetical protein
MKKLLNRWSQIKNTIQKATKGYEENIFLVVGLLIAIGVPLFFLWNPIEFKEDDAQARSVLQAVEIPIDDGGGNDNGGGGGNPGGGGGGGGRPPRPNGQPNIRNDDVRTNVDVPITIDVLDNDRPRDGVPLNEGSIRIVRQPDNGTVEILPDNTIRYTPNPGFAAGDIGSDDFRYEVDSQNGQTDGADVRVTVIAIGRPETNPDDATTFEDTPVTIDVLANDGTNDDIPLDLSTVEILEQPENGTAVLNPDNTITYTPNPGFFGDDELEYNVCAVNGTCDSEPVRIEVIEVPFDQVGNQPPVANDDTAATGSGIPVTIPALANDFDSDGDLTAANTTVTVQPTNGTVTVGANGDLFYTPDSTFIGTDTLTYQIQDNDGLTDTAVVTITVTEQAPTSQPPVAVNDQATTPANSPVTVNVLVNDTDPDDDINPASLAVITQPTNGTAIVNDQDRVIYTPNTDYVGPDTFTYQISDSEGSTATATVSITVEENPVPEANDDTVAITQNDTTVIDILTNDTSPASPLDVTSVTIITQPANGFVTVNPDGTIEYTPNQDYTGPDSLVYQVSNSSPNPQSDVATVNITVSEDIIPIAVNDSGTTRKNNSVTVPILDNDTIPGGEVTPDMFTGIVTPPANGTVIFDDTTGEVTYTPNVDFTGGDSFTYEIEGPDGTSSATVLINVQNPLGPDALDDEVTINEDSTIDIDVLANDVPGDGALDAATLTIETQPSNGVTSVDTSTGIVTYTPNADFIGTDSFTYEIGNTEGEFDTATVLVTVVEDAAPDALDDSIGTDVDTSVVIPVLDNDVDSLNSILPDSVSIVSQPQNGTVTVNADGTITYTPEAGYQGTDTFAYQIENEAGKFDVATVSVVVQQVAPIDVETQSRIGQVLGASEIVDGELARTGGLDEIASNFVIILGVILATGFFTSLYFIKANSLK